MNSVRNWFFVVLSVVSFLVLPALVIAQPPPWGGSLRDCVGGGEIVNPSKCAADDEPCIDEDECFSFPIVCPAGGLNPGTPCTHVKFPVVVEHGYCSGDVPQGYTEHCFQCNWFICATGFAYTSAARCEMQEWTCQIAYPTAFACDPS